MIRNHQKGIIKVPILLKSFWNMFRGLSRAVAVRTIVLALKPRGSRYIVNPRKLEHGFRTINAGIPYTLPYKGMRAIMFQLSGFYFTTIMEL